MARGGEVGSDGVVDDAFDFAAVDAAVAGYGALAATCAVPRRIVCSTSGGTAGTGGASCTAAAVAGSYDMLGWLWSARVLRFG